MEEPAEYSLIATYEKTREYYDDTRGRGERTTPGTVASLRTTHMRSEQARDVSATLSHTPARVTLATLAQSNRTSSRGVHVTLQRERTRVPLLPGCATQSEPPSGAQHGPLQSSRTLQVPPYRSPPVLQPPSSPPGPCRSLPTGALQSYRSLQEPYGPDDTA
eukprot:1178509-Prorocentrum_minimum.AAC.1